MSDLKASVNEKGIMMKLEKETIFISGSIDCIEPGVVMAPFISKVHEYILKNKIKKIYVNIADLDFLNSSGIKQFVDWIMRLDNAAENERYKIVFIYNKNTLWQESSVTALTYINNDVVEIMNK